MEEPEAKKITVTINSPSGAKTFEVRPGVGFQALCAKYQTTIEFSCRKADCGICAVKIIQGMEHLSPPTVAEADFLKAMGADQDERLACQVRILGNVDIKVDYL